MMKKKNKFTKRLTKIALVIGAEVLLFSGCLVMIYARGTGESENQGTYQENVTLGTKETNAGAEKQSSLQAGTNQDKNITSPVNEQKTAGTAQVSNNYNTVATEKMMESESETETDVNDDSAVSAAKTDSEMLYVEPISQLPELPTGCEITSLTMALNYEGYDIDKEDLADNYLTKGRPGVNSYEDAFLGNPREEDSYGCFAPVIVRTANKYLTEQNSAKRAYDVSGTELEDLFDEIRSGNPVIIWGSMNIDVDIEYTDEWEIDGKLLRWPGNEHCMVLSGFDLNNETVTVCDPLREVETYDFDSFERHFKQMDKMAVVIK
ncbi:C39 family peptidase [Robinsoniella sp. KNHs210]|uniref:C39 family peptidase n=1 Tax=Robinsoniella sp. KNHs210 TaxID=1469950 RepID=UPI0009E0865C|nr:C39 family peptidase [Robinsoniella sp. KNHs210]